MKEKELEKIENCQMLREEIRCIWQVSKVTVIRVVVGALGVISDMFERYIKKLDAKIAMEIIQKAALLGRAMLLRKVVVSLEIKRRSFETLCDLLLLFLKHRFEKYLTKQLCLKSK